MNECLVTFITSEELEENASPEMSAFWREIRCPVCGDHWLIPETQEFTNCKKCQADIITSIFHVWWREIFGVKNLNVISFHSGILTSECPPKPYFPRRWTDPIPYFPKRWLTFNNVIREWAFKAWNKAGCPYHEGVEFWLEAKWDLLREVL